MLLVVGAAIALVPVSSTGGERYDCGPALTSTFRLVEPADPDRFVPVSPGADAGVSARVDCQDAAFRPTVSGLLLAAVGGVLVVLGRRAQSAAAVRPWAG